MRSHQVAAIGDAVPQDVVTIRGEPTFVESLLDERLPERGPVLREPLGARGFRLAC